MATFDEIKARASLAETSVRLVLAGQHLEQIRVLEEELRDAPEPMSLGERSPKRVIAERIAALQDEMRDSTEEFHLRAIGGRAWNKFKLTQPIRAPDQSVEDAADRFFDWLCRLVSRTLTDPVLTPEQVAELCDVLPGASWDELSDAAWSINAGKVSVPFSAVASALILPFDETSKPQSGSASRPHASAANRKAKPPPTSTTTLAV